MAYFGVSSGTLTQESLPELDDRDVSSGSSPRQRSQPPGSGSPLWTRSQSFLSSRNKWFIGPRPPPTG